ncbi:MAG: hypothetical protein HRU09_19190 [Oligoflexales bacterium]|nr:hypothetical protein [Oligoflexales bacterium]
MRVLWDEKKSKVLKENPKRRTSFEEAKVILQDENRDIGGGLKSYDPEQHYAICFASNGSLTTLVYEFRHDKHGPYIWLVTLWKTTKEEKRQVERK